MASLGPAEWLVIALIVALTVALVAGGFLLARWLWRRFSGR
jgi:hypothetical protein